MNWIGRFVPGWPGRTAILLGVLLKGNMNESERLLRVVDGIYEASLDTAQFPKMLKGVAEFVGGVSADYYIQRDSRVIFGSYFGISQDLYFEYLSHYHAANPRLLVCAAAPEMQIITDLEKFSEGEMAQHPMFQEFLPKAGLGHALLIVPMRSSLGFVGMGIHLAEAQGPPDDSSYRAMNTLLPHLRRLSQIRIRLTEQQIQGGLLKATINLLSIGVILLDLKGQVVAINQAAELLLDGSKLLSLERGFLRPSRRADRHRLDRFIAGASARGKTLVAPGGAMRIKDLASGEGLSLIISPLPTGRRLREGLGAIVFISDGEAAISELAQQRLQTLWGLTSAEAKVAAAIASGRALTNYAHQTGISVHTARNQLKQAFGKTETCRQAELAQLVLLGPGYLRDPSS